MTPFGVGCGVGWRHAWTIEDHDANDPPHSERGIARGFREATAHAAGRTHCVSRVLTDALIEALQGASEAREEGD